MIGHDLAGELPVALHDLQVYSSRRGKPEAQMDLSTPHNAAKPGSPDHEPASHRRRARCAPGQRGTQPSAPPGGSRDGQDG